MERATVAASSVRGRSASVRGDRTASLLPSWPLSWRITGQRANQPLPDMVRPMPGFGWPIPADALRPYLPGRMGRSRPARRAVTQVPSEGDP
ncbi:hypothetical protein GCM10012278_34050 [Nonomuraea glycinis]|uniref:Uncharacterized protein n=1 Tax=Nonomuraea glycinis TaxID=2047744 RepID=A0A918E4Q2_9ACTN|nr:hypothetical protein GCM10012278_34050 [Nonomuraea glycinis]